MNVSGILLAMETSSDVCGIALTRDGQLISECRFRHAMHLSERILGEMDTLLKSSGVTLKEVDAFAVGVGPGSFTGTRIGVMTIKTLASVQGKPIYGINSLEALAAHYTGLQNVTVIPVLPCRPGTVFAALYDVSGTVPHALVAPNVLTVEALEQAIVTAKPKAIGLCGSGVERYRQELEPISDSFPVSFGISTEPLPAMIACLADLRRAFGEPADDVLALAPLYLAPPPITQSKTPIPTTIPV